MNVSVAIVFALLLMTAPVAEAQGKLPPETRNAALRYWMAFAEIKDPPSDKATQDLLGKTAAGEAAWDETKLAPILDANAGALAIFQRATKLPDCDWGVEYREGPRASIAYAPRARVIARLNTLQGLRELAKGNSQAAVDAWLAGIRFSRDLSRGGTLIFNLTAKSALLSDLSVLSKAAQDGKLTNTQKRAINDVVKTLPPDGFNWYAAWGLESAGIEILVQQLQTDPDPRRLYESMSGDPVSNNPIVISSDDLAKFQKFANDVQNALKLPPAQAVAKLETLQVELHSLNPVIERFVPSPLKVNGARIEIDTARRELLRSLTAK